MAVPEVYEGFGSGVSSIGSELGNKNIMTGPNWFYTLTGNAGGMDGSTISTSRFSDQQVTYRLGRDNKNTNWYCLDLAGKYHKNSALKQFHALTFYFRNSLDAKKGAIITSSLPESFTYSIGGVYNNPIQLGGSDFAKAVTAAFTSNTKGLSFNADTSLIWQSPKRMEIIFKIPIFDDSGSGTNINYQEAIELFSEAILPQVGEDGLYRSIPGPNIIRALRYRATNESGGVATIAAQKIDDAVIRGQFVRDKDNNIIGKTKLSQLINSEGQLWDRISVQVGGLLLLDWCVIKDLKVTFPNTKAQVLHDFRSKSKKRDSEGNLISNKARSGNTSLEDGTRFKAHLQPIQAELEVTVSTVMGMTRATFRDMLYQNESIENSLQVKTKPGVCETGVNPETTSSGPLEEDDIDYPIRDGNGQPIVPVIFAL